MTTPSACELLLPVGNMKMCLAAIHNGADAIYVGVPEFNARGRTQDYTISDLKEMIELCHLYGVKVNLAFNVLIFEDELAKAIHLLKEIIPLNPDAFIVQDLGLVKIIKEMSPHIAIHASTQMTVTNFEAMELLSDLNIKRYVLGREVSIEEMKKIREKTNRELEVFVHGALCVAYSGQCFTSEKIGGRSANRGQCAQSCRFEYDLVVDGLKLKSIDEKYLVSPQDLCGISETPSLLDLNINSFKIEGRLKTPEYVAITAKAYREAIDQYRFKKIPLKSVRVGELKNKLALTFSRGFFSGWLNGVDHQKLVPGTFSSHRGIFLGEVLKVSNKRINVLTSHELKKGDGIMLAYKKSNSSDRKENETGGKIFDLKLLKKLADRKFEYEIVFHKTVDLKKIAKGDFVYQNSDDALSSDLTKSFEDKNQKKRISINVKIIAKLNQPLKLMVVDDLQNSIELNSNVVLIKAQNSPIAKVDLENELNALGGSIYKIEKCTIELENGLFIHHKEIKTLRQKMIAELNNKRIYRPIVNYKEFENLSVVKVKQTIEKTKLNVLLRNKKSLEAFLACQEFCSDQFGIIYLDYEFGADYVPSIKLLKEKKYKCGIATTRILKASEYHNFKLIERANPDVILIRNLGALYYFKDANFELRGDFSLNVSNTISKDYLLSKNLKSVTASYDLNFEHLTSLLKNSNPGEFEVTIHQYMPSFHMEHCVFAATLSNGSSFRDCGKPCEKHKVELIDQFGNRHFLKADQECRNTMYNGVAQSAGSKISELKKLGVSEFRFEALEENTDKLLQKISAYLLLINNSNDEMNELNSILAKISIQEKYGLDDGVLGIKKEYQARKKV